MFTEDLSPFFADFGETISLGGLRITAIFDNGFLSAGVLGIEFESVNPVVQVKTSDLPAEAHDLPVDVRGVAYEVVSIEPDGTGISQLQLRRLQCLN